LKLQISFYSSLAVGSLAVRIIVNFVVLGVLCAPKDSEINLTDYQILTKNNRQTKPAETVKNGKKIGMSGLPTDRL
jgi:hypothetical protein